MEEDEKQPIIVIRRIKKVRKEGHHGGSWKIAYADFVTAMMAFFLLMWLLSLLNKYQLQGIAEYFQKPLKEVLRPTSNIKEAAKDKEKDKEKAKQKPEKVDKPDQKAKEKMAKLLEMKKDLENKLQTHPELKQFKNQLNFTVTANGLKIELRDLEKKPMFTTGKADFEKYSQTIISWLGKELNNYPNQLVIIGHTDGAQFRDENKYSNWELSADRANATRRVLIKSGGMQPNKILRIIGVGDQDLLDDKNNLNPANRRIEIIVLSDDAVKKMSANKKNDTNNNAPPTQSTVIKATITTPVTQPKSTQSPSVPANASSQSPDNAQPDKIQSATVQPTTSQSPASEQPPQAPASNAHSATTPTTASQPPAGAQSPASSAHSTTTQPDISQQPADTQSPHAQQPVSTNPNNVIPIKTQPIISQPSANTPSTGPTPTGP